MKSQGATSNHFYQIHVKPQSYLFGQTFHSTKDRSLTKSMDRSPELNETFEQKLQQRMKNLISAKDPIKMGPRLQDLRLSKKKQIKTSKILRDHEVPNQEVFEINQLKNKINNLEQEIIKNQYVTNQNETFLKGILIKTGQLQRKIFELSEVKKQDGQLGELTKKIEELQKKLQKKDQEVLQVKQNFENKLTNFFKQVEQMHNQSYLDEHDQAWSNENRLPLFPFQKKKFQDQKLSHNFVDQIRAQIENLLHEEVRIRNC